MRAQIWLPRDCSDPSSARDGSPTAREGLTVCNPATRPAIFSSARERGTLILLDQSTAITGLGLLGVAAIVLLGGVFFAVRAGSRSTFELVTHKARACAVSKGQTRSEARGACGAPCGEGVYCPRAGNCFACDVWAATAICYKSGGLVEASYTAAEVGVACRW